MVSWAHPLWFTCGFVPATPKGFHIPSHRLSPLCTLLVSHHRLIWDTGNLRTCSPSSRRWRQTLLAWMHLPLLLSRAADACWCDIPPVTRSLLPYGLSSFPAPPAQVTGAASAPLMLFLSPILEEGEQKRMLFNLKVKNLMPLFGSAKATSPFDSDESLLAAWAGGRPPGSSGEIDWKENTWLNLLPPPHLAPLHSCLQVPRLWIYRQEISKRQPPQTE